MIAYENKCSDCDGIYRDCARCQDREVEVHYCDHCKEEIDDFFGEIYEVDDLELCEECLKEMFRRK